MIFGGIFGVIGVMSEGDTTPGQWFTFYCWSTVAIATCLVPAFFWHEPMKEFLYERLGKEYVTSRVGNPGVWQLGRLGTGILTGGVIQGAGLWQNSHVFGSTQDKLDISFEKSNTQINNNRDNAINAAMNSGLDPRDQHRAIQETLKIHTKQQSQLHNTYEEKSKANMKNYTEYKPPFTQVADWVKSGENTERIAVISDKTGKVFGSVGKYFTGKGKDEN